MLRDLGKIIVAKCFKKLPKVKKNRQIWSHCNDTTYLTYVYRESSWVKSIGWKVYWADLREDYKWNDLSYFCPSRVLPSKLNRLEGLLSRFMRTLQWNDLSYFCPLIVLLNKLLRFLRPSSYPNARRCLEGWRPSRWIWRPCEAAISCIVSLKKCLCLVYSTALRYQRKGKELECLFTKLRYPTS